ncbi:MAG: Cytochrome-c peroxidase [Bacteroidetes bacterium]|nr:Cytochrome-c peroxidase [Bacteroidota bacterium]
MLTGIMAVILLVTSCQHETPLKALTPNPAAQSYNYKTTSYEHVRQMGGDNSADDTLTNGGAILGRLLFYDPRLSINNAVACATCHKQQFAFADNQAFSEGYQGQMTLRNTPAIINAANKSSFFWDGRVTSLENQTLMPVRNHIEMGLERTDVLVKKISQISYYAQYFQNAFGSPEVTSDRISKALAQFVRSIASAESPADAFTLSTDAQLGQSLFFGRLQCGTCHRGNNFGGAPMFDTYFGGGIDIPVNAGGGSDQVPNTSNIGLDVAYTDQGEQALTGRTAQNGYFVIPSLRNVILTAPYMHDGRFKTLDEVIDHYSNGIQPHPNLDPLLLQQNFNQRFVTVASGQPVRMNISADERRELKAFLNSLTDKTIISDPKFANPFK